MNLDMLGKIGAITGFVTLILTVATANVSERFHPMPLFIFSMALNLILNPIQLLFLIPGLSSDTYLWIQLAFNFLGVPIGLITAMAGGPLLMTILPRERYGQFAAAQATLRNILGYLLGSMLAGWLMRVMQDRWGDYARRLSFAWYMLFFCLTLLCYYLLYREWKRLGGRKGFKPPPVGPVANEVPAGEAASGTPPSV